MPRILVKGYNGVERYLLGSLVDTVQILVHLLHGDGGQLEVLAHQGRGAHPAQGGDLLLQLGQALNNEGGKVTASQGYIQSN